MKRTLIILACLILAVSVLLVACGKKNKDELATVVYSTDADTGEVYVTNTDGDRIPVTTSKDGSVELYEDLITKTVKQVEQEKASISEAEAQNQDNGNANANTDNNTNANTNANTNNTTQANQQTNTTSAQQKETTTNEPVEVVSGDVLDEEHAAVIDWSN